MRIQRSEGLGSRLPPIIILTFSNPCDKVINLATCMQYARVKVTVFCCMHLVGINFSCFDVLIEVFHNT